MTALGDLRKCQRIRLVRPFYGQFVAVRELFILRDISLGGFSVEGAVCFPLGASHAFKFRLQPDREAVLTGTVKHCLQINNGHAGPLYLTGFEFLRGGIEDATAIKTLMNAAAHEQADDALTTE